MMIKALVENTTVSDDYLTEHGLSLYVETPNHKLLFDVGQSDKYILNAQKIGIDLSKVDTVIISHGHYDHGRGLAYFSDVNHIAKIYINENAFGEHYSDDGRYIGLDQELKTDPRMILTSDETTIDDELFLFTGNQNKREYFMDTYGILVKEQDQFLPDPFFHEQYLIISEGEKKILISGCSHKGILNIMNWVKNEDIHTMIGGFHFMEIDMDQDGAYLDNVSAILKTYPCQYYTCHCTGLEPYNYLKMKMNDQIHYLSTGNTIIL